MITTTYVVGSRRGCAVGCVSVAVVESWGRRRLRREHTGVCNNITSTGDILVVIVVSVHKRRLDISCLGKTSQSLTSLLLGDLVLHLHVLQFLYSCSLFGTIIPLPFCLLGFALLRFRFRRRHCPDVKGNNNNVSDTKCCVLWPWTYLLTHRGRLFLTTVQRVFSQPAACFGGSSQSKNLGTVFTASLHEFSHSSM